MPSTFVSTDALYDALNLSRQTGRVIGIEGHSTSGKSHLGKELANASGATLISTDTYARERQHGDRYQDLIDLARLRADVVVGSERRFVFVEGICLRDVLNAADVKPDLFVYIKRITAAGLWADDPENYLTDGRPNPDLSWVDRQSALYHIQHSPLEFADFVYERREA